MSALGSLYIKLGEPDGELCGCTCEVGDWAAVYIADLIQQRDKLLAALVDLVNQPQDITTPAYQAALAAIQECEK